MGGKVKKSSLIWPDVCLLKNFVKGVNIDEKNNFFFFFTKKRIQDAEIMAYPPATSLFN